MKTKRAFNFFRNSALAANGVALLATSLQAGSFNYTSTDLLLNFRTSGQPDLVVDIGSAAIYDAVPAGTTITVTNLPTGIATLVNGTYPSLDGLNWSVLGSQRTFNNVNYPIQTVWASAPRVDPLVQSKSWARQGQFTQGSYASQIDKIGANAATYSGLHPNAANNNDTAVVIPANDQNAYTPLVNNPFDATASDLGGTFQGAVENTTPFDFDSDEPLSRSDLYKLLPGSGNGKWVGYFSFTPDGIVTFTAASVLPAPPAITSVSRNGNITTVSFASVNALTYSLRATDAAGLATPVSTWPVVGGTIIGNGTVLSLQATNSSASSFYAIAVHQ